MPAVGMPAVGVPAVGVPAVGVPAVGVPAVGVPAVTLGVVPAVGETDPAIPLTLPAVVIVEVDDEPSSAEQPLNAMVTPTAARMEPLKPPNPVWWRKILCRRRLRRIALRCINRSPVQSKLASLLRVLESVVQCQHG